MTLRLAALALASAALLHCSAPEIPPPGSPAVESSEWVAWGGDPGGQRHAALDAITPENVGELAHAWTHRHGDVADGRPPFGTTSAFQNTPLLVDGSLYLCTPFNRVLALDPATGQERWSFDPGIDAHARYANQLVCRGVAHWRDARVAEGSGTCAARIFTATNEAELIALDAETGEPCAGFGAGGRVDLNAGAGEQNWKGEYQVTSPPAVVGDLVVVGTAVSDNGRIDAPSGVVRAFDARSGALAWAWDLAPPGFDYATGLVSDAGWALGTPNVWAPMAVDEARGLLFVPTGNASPDYYHGERSDMNHYGSSVVALWARTGAVVWRFQTVHQDLWDFDVPAQPTLATVEIDGRPRDAVVQTTKMGLVFVLDRDTGRPLHAVEERPVPSTGAAPGEIVSPTQPFPKTPILVPHELSPDDAWGLTPWDRGACRDEIERRNFAGMYTPPSERGTIMYPGNAGGSNWGGLAVDPARQLAIVRTTNLAWVVTLIPRERYEAEYEADRAAGNPHELAPQIGTPYGMRRQMLLSPLGLPCVAPPWGTLSAVDLRSGEVRWQVPHGTVRDIAPVPVPWKAGVPGIGGPMVTAGGVIFIGGAMDDYLRAFETETGRELWKARLPAGPQANPMSYRLVFEDGSARQYVLVAAGGHGGAGTTLGDHLIAFALEEPAPWPSPRERVRRIS